MYWGMRHPWDTPLSAFLFALCFMATVHLAESSTLLKWAGYGCVGDCGVVQYRGTRVPAFCRLDLLPFRQGKPFFRNAVAGAVLFFAVIAPWCIRDYRVFHKFVPIRGNFGVEFHLGNTPTPWEPGNRSSILRKTYWSCGSIRRWGRLPTSTANWR